MSKPPVGLRPAVLHCQPRAKSLFADHVPAFRIAQELSVNGDDAFVSAMPKNQPCFGRSCLEHFG